MAPPSTPVVNHSISHLFGNRTITICLLYWSGMIHLRNIWYLLTCPCLYTCLWKNSWKCPPCHLLTLTLKGYAIFSEEAQHFPLSHCSQKVSSIQQLTPYDQRNVTPSLITPNFPLQAVSSQCQPLVFHSTTSTNPIMILCMRLAFGGIGGDIPNCDLLPEVMHFTNWWFSEDI